MILSDPTIPVNFDIDSTDHRPDDDTGEWLPILLPELPAELPDDGDDEWARRLADDDDTGRSLGG